MSTTWIIIIAVIAFAVLLCFLLSIANNAYDRFLDRYNALDKEMVSTGLTTLDFVGEINYKTFSNKIQVIQISQLAGDAYSNGKIFLSTKTINSRSIASITIVAHELGHAKQDIEGKKLKVLKVLRILGKALGVLLPLVLIAGVVLLFFPSLLTYGLVLLGVGGGIFLLALFNKLFTISIEKDASKKAIVLLKDYLADDEMKKAKRFLKDARLTYWADFLRAILGWTMLSKKSKLF